MIERNEKGQFKQCREDITGKRFGRLTAIEFSHKNANRKTYWLFLCDCGNTIVARTDQVKSGNTKSCGCLKKETDAENVKKAQSSDKSHCQPKYKDIGTLNDNPIYQRWRGIKRRCYNHNYSQYCNYGGRGITMCDDWLYNFRKFYEWSIEHGFDEGKDIHRVDNDGNYEPNNCVYIDHMEHMQLHWQHRDNQLDCEKAN